MRYLFNRHAIPYVIACWLAFTNAATNLGLLLGDTPRKPDVVFILADDLGWSDTTLYGTTNFYRTPNIERLAARGMTFTRAYTSSPLCSPTRASILTGLSPARIGITSPNCHLPTVTLQATVGDKAAADTKAILPNSASLLKTEYYTLAETFRDHGYATAHFGKWHLGATPYSPLEHGFKLFNLKVDIGEHRDLSDQNPERVQQLNSLIDKFMVNTGAVLPIVNRKFDPTKYQPELEGKAKLKQNSQDNAKGDNTGKASKQLASTPQSSQPVAGWKADGTCELAVKDYSVEFSPQSSLLAVRIDPCSGPGDVKILKMHLSTKSGRLLHTWTF